VLGLIQSVLVRTMHLADRNVAVVALSLSGSFHKERVSCHTEAICSKTGPSDKSVGWLGVIVQSVGDTFKEENVY
jgi:hypothetical protein